jgi:hypothetical protein
MKVRVKESLDWYRDRVYAVQVQYIPFTPWFKKADFRSEAEALQAARVVKYPLIREIA